jgi:hypothetical protein
MAQDAITLLDHDFVDAERISGQIQSTVGQIA